MFLPDRLRLGSFLMLVAVLAFAPGCGKGTSKGGADSTQTSGSGAAGNVKVGLVFDVGGRGDQSFNEQQVHESFNEPAAEAAPAEAAPAEELPEA